MSVATEVATHWPDHIDCADYGPAQYVDGEGIVCGCGAVLGYPPADPAPGSNGWTTETDIAHERMLAAKLAESNRTGYRPGDQDPDMLDDLQSQTDHVNEQAAEFDGPIGDGPQGPAYYSPVAAEAGGSGFSDTPPWDTSDRTGHVNDAGGVGEEYGPFSEAQDYDAPPWGTSNESDGEVQSPRTPGDDSLDGMSMRAFKAAQAEGSRHAREIGLADQQAIGSTTPAARSLPEPNSASGAEDPINARVAAIDPTVIYTPVDVERVLVDIERRLEAGQLYQRVWERRLYEVSIAHELAWAKAIRASNASAADMRKADATIECIDSLAAKLEADIMTRAVRETMHNLRSMLSGFQSIARSVGASMTASGMDTNREIARYR